MLQDQMSRRFVFAHSAALEARENITQAGSKAGQDQRKRLRNRCSLFHLYLGMHEFVWDRALCGTRISVSAAVDCSGAISKIRMRKIEMNQGLVHDGKYGRFYDSGTFDEATGTMQPRVH